MKYDFQTIIDRHGKDAMALDLMRAPHAFADTETEEGYSRIPMWVADMNFATAPSIIRALKDRVEHPCFGYFLPRKAYYDAIKNWHKIRNGVNTIENEYIGYENGVLGGVMSAVSVLCQQGDSILLHSPTYIGFTNSLKNAGYHIVHSALKPDEDGIWRMDYADMEKKIRENHIHCMIFCSPHNPTGRVWEREELESAAEIFKRNDVYVISDEIWSDLILEGSHVPLQEVSEDMKQRTISLYAPSKTFNLAGLVGSYHIVYDRYLRERMLKQSSLCHYNDMNVLSMHALIGAYSEEGAEWTDELCEVIRRNVDIMTGFLKKEYPEIKFMTPQGTYMLFLDCSDFCDKYGITIDELQVAGVRKGVIWQDGRPFGGEATIRMNLALPESMLREALDRLAKVKEEI